MGLFDKVKSTLAPRKEPVPTQRMQSFMDEDCEGSNWNDAPFDFENEPETWFIAERRLEHVFEDPANFQTLALEYGVEDADHFLRLREAWTHYKHTLVQTQGQGALKDLLQRGLNAETN